MNGAFYIGATGLDAQQRALDVISNNISNMNTSGYKRSNVRFSELITRSPTHSGDVEVRQPIGATITNGVDVTTNSRVWTQGTLRQSGSENDLAIDGSGFVSVLGEDGQELLWRGGALKVSADGFLATADGRLFQAMIAVPQDAGALIIAPDGTVSAVMENEPAPREIGRIELARVSDPSLLADAGRGYFFANDPSSLTMFRAGEEGAGTFAQGALEGSNVELSTEMIQLLVLQRAYAANAQVVQAGDTIMAINNGLRR